MKDLNLSRRAVMLGAAALPLARTAASQARPRPVVVSSANAFNGGIRCCAKAMELIQSGSDTLDAVIAGVNIVELDPRDTSVGYGGLPKAYPQIIRRPLRRYSLPTHSHTGLLPPSRRMT